MEKCQTNFCLILIFSHLINIIDLLGIFLLLLFVVLLLLFNIQ